MTFDITTKDYTQGIIQRRYLVDFGRGHRRGSVLEPFLPQSLDPGIVGSVHSVVLLVRLVGVGLGLLVLKVLVVNHAHAEQTDGSTNHELAALKTKRFMNKRFYLIDVFRLE